MAETKLTLGQAIDQIISALQELDQETRVTAVTAACKHLNVELPQHVQYRESAAREPAIEENIKTGSQSAHSGHKVDIRSLKEQKNPESARQMACVVAYYLQELAPVSDRKQTITTQDVEKYFKQAGFKLPKKIEDVLVASKRAGYFESPARGEYKLNAVGYNLAAHGLPAKKGS